MDGASVVMVLSKIPPLFCNWWAKQIQILNNENARLTFHMVLLADALPCSWTSLVHLRGSRLDAMRLDRYRRKTTFFDPCVPVAMTSATSTHVVLKKMRAITFTTEAVDGSFEKVFSTWQVQRLPAAEAPARLMVDCVLGDELKVQSLLQVLAYRTNTEMSARSIRSFGSTCGCHRRMFYLYFNEDQTEQNVLEIVRAGVASHGVHNVAVGREAVCKLPEETFIVTFDNSAWIDDPTLNSLLDDIVFSLGLQGGGSFAHILHSGAACMRDRRVFQTVSEQCSTITRQ